MPYAAVDSERRKLAEPEEYVGFALCDPLEKRIGRVETLFLNVSGEPEYISVRMGFFGFKRLLIPVQSVAVNEQQRMLVLKESTLVH